MPKISTDISLCALNCDVYRYLSSAVSKSVIQYPSSLLGGNPFFEIAMNDEAQREIDKDVEENAELYEALADESDE
jgi:hypothetical protein